MKPERLTYKIKFAFNPIKPLKYAPKNQIWTEDGDGESLFNLVDVLNKLGALEDIEEWLGVDLLTFFKSLESLEKGVFVKEFDGEISLHEVMGIAKSGILVIDNDAPCPECDSCMDYGDYGKTWAFTKEELEEEK